jgi:hypothetical protein
MRNAPAEALPLVGLPAVLLWNMAEDGTHAAACVDSCITLRYALAEYGVASKIEAVGVGISAAGTEPTLYGPDGGMRPHYNADGTFNGHTILLIPAAGRFLDPTVQQFPAIPRTVRASVPDTDAPATGKGFPVPVISFSYPTIRYTAPALPGD